MLEKWAQIKQVRNLKIKGLMTINPKGLSSKENIELFKKSQEIDQIKIPGSNESLSSVSASTDIILTVPKTKNKSLDFSIELDSQISFPVAAGTIIGQLKVNIPNESSEYFDIYSTNELKRTNIFSRFFSYIYQSIVNLFV